MNWSQARDWCEHRGMQLATLTNKSEVVEVGGKLAKYTGSGAIEFFLAN
jgi:hypothetical protein